MGALSAILSEQDVEHISHLLDMVEASPFLLFEASVGDVTVRIERLPAVPVDLVELTAPAIGVYRQGTNTLATGKSVLSGAVIGQIETLDQRTDVVISQAGAIADVLVLDGQFVEYGQKLLSIEPTVT